MFSIPFPISKYVYENLTEDEYFLLRNQSQSDIERQLPNPVESDQSRTMITLLTEEERLGWGTVIQITLIF